jgi:hypothetical protein
MKFILILLITIVPITAWGYYFYIKNPRKSRFSEIIKIFIFGMLSIAPVFIFHMYFLDPVTEYLTEVLNIGHIAILPPLMELLVTAVFIIVFLFIFAVIQSAILRIVWNLPWGMNFKTVFKKMYNLTPLFIVFLLFAVIEFIFNLGIHISFIFSLAGSTVIFAVIEEYFKYVINPFLAYRKLNSIGSAIVNTLYVGLAFSFVENILFFLNAQGSDGFLMIFVYRSVFTTLLHVCASGILGYFYGLSLFSKSILANYEIEKGQYKALAPLQKFLGIQKKSVFENISVTQGFFAASAFHAVVNLLIYFNLKMISGILIIASSFFIVYLLNLKSTQIQYGIIGTHELPEEDFEQLRLKISVLQHLKEIRGAQLNRPPIAPQTINVQTSPIQTLPQTPPPPTQVPPVPPATDHPPQKP